MNMTRKVVSARLVLFAAILLGFALRMINLEGRSIWYDEAFAILFSEKSFAAMWHGTVTSVQGGAADVHPLFYYSLLHYWIGLAGDAALAARLLSILFGVATIPVIFRLGRELFGEQVGVASAVFLSAAPFHVAYSQEARMYAQLGFLAALALFAFVRYERTRLEKWWLVFVLSGTGAVYTHNLGFLFLFSIGCYVLLKREWLLVRGTLLAGLAIVALWLPWLILLPDELSKISQSYWVPRPDGLSLVQTIVSFTLGFDNARVPAWLIPLGLFLAILFLALAAYAAARQPRRELVFIVTVAVVPPVFLFVLSQWHPVYITRALIPSFLALVVIVAWAIGRLPRLPRALLAASAALVALASFTSYYGYSEFPRPPFRQALDYLSVNAREGDTIVHDNKLSYFPMHYYDRGRAQSFVPDPVGAGSDTLALPTQQALGLFATPLDVAVRGHARIWFVIFEQALDEGGGNLAWLNENFRLTRTQRFNDLDVFLYQK